MESSVGRIRFGIATDEPVSGLGLQAVCDRAVPEYRLIWLPGSLEDMLHALHVLPVEVLLLDMAAGFPPNVVPRLRAAGVAAPVLLWMRDATGVESAPDVAFLDKRSSPELVLACVEALIEKRAPVDWEPGRPTLSARESELMLLVAEGLSNRQIGERLGLTEGSVKVYFSRLYRKIGVTDRVGLALYAVKRPWERPGRTGASPVKS